MCSSVSGYSFSFNPKVLGGRAIVLGFRVRVRVRVRVRIRIRELGDQNYEVGFETIGTVTQNYANFDYSGYFSSTFAWIFPMFSAVHFLAFAYLVITFWSKECVITGIEGLMSSGSVTNVTGTLFRMRNEK
jgi:hypothetical protein